MVPFKAYFNYAGLAPTTERIKQEMCRAQQEFDRVLFSEAGVEGYFQLLRDCREAADKMLGEPGISGISLMPNASFALSIAFRILQTVPEKVILTSDQEHPAVEAPLGLLSRRGLDVRKISAETSSEFAERVEAMVKRSAVGLIVLSHVSYKDGRILPVERVGEIASRARIPYLVDGSQAVGHITVDIRSIQPSIYVFSGHKWLFGPMGTGVLWVASSIAGVNEELGYSWAARSGGEDMGGKLEAGTMNLALISGLLEAMREATKQLEQRFHTLTRLRVEIDRRLSVLPFVSRVLSRSAWTGPYAPGILTYCLPDHIPSWHFAESLFNRSHVVVKPFKPPERPNAIRISFAPWTSSDETESLIQALAAELGHV